MIEMRKNNTKYRISIKSFCSGCPAIINHTHRSANAFREKGDLSKYTPALDVIVQEYIDKRTNAKKDLHK